MTKLDGYLAEVKARCEKATKRPWWSDGRNVWVDTPSTHFHVAQCLKPVGIDGEPDPLADSRFIACARTDVEVLVKMVELLRPAGTDWAKPLKAKLEALVPEGE